MVSMLYLPQILDLVNPVVIFHQEQSLHCLGVIEADRRRHAKSHLKVSTRLKLLWLIRRTSGLVGPSCNILSRIFFSSTCYPNRAHISALHHMALLGLFLPPYATASARCEPTSVELHKQGLWRRLYRLGYRAAAFNEKSWVLHLF